MTTDTLATLITQKYGVIKRARGPFLYTASGVRLTDLYLEGGRAILGWRAGSALTVFKNVLSRGATGSYDTGYWGDVQKAVCTLFGGERRVFAFHDKATALRAACVISDKTMFYRPWGADAREADCIVFAPPFPWGDRLYLLAVKAGLAGTDDVRGERVPSALAAAIARSIYDLAAELPRRCEKDWFTHDKVLSAWWERRGPYLYPKAEAVSAERYDDFVTACMDCAVVISPDYNTPSILSPGLDAGVFKALLKATGSEEGRLPVIAHLDTPLRGIR